MGFMILAGTPPIITLEGILSATTAPAAIMVFLLYVIVRD